MNWLSNLFKGPQANIIDQLHGQLQGQANETKKNAFEQRLAAAQKPFNPAEYQGFDTSPLRQSLTQALQKGSARRRGQMAGGFGRMGVASSGDAYKGLGDIAGQEAEAEAGINAQLGRMDWEDRLNQWRQGQQSALQSLALQNQYENMQYNRQREEEANREDPLGDILGLAGTGLGAWAGSPIGGDWLTGLFGGGKKKKGKE